MLETAPPGARAGGLASGLVYLAADDARSDFFLAAAVYVIGPSIVALLLRAVPQVTAVPVLGVVLLLALPFLLTAAMPLFLLRYREGSFAALRTGGTAGLLLGATCGAVVAAGVAAAELLAGGDPVAVAGEALLVGAVAAVTWLSLAVLAVFLHRRAEYAFRPVSEHQSTLVRQAAAACLGTAAVATLLLVLAGQPPSALLVVLGLVGAFALAERRLPQQGLGERWWVWAPVVALAIGPLQLLAAFFGAAEGFLVSAQQAAAVGLFGLLVVMGLHARRGARPAFGLALLVAVAEVLSVAAPDGYAL
jgi:hypothetical protein